MTVWLSGLFASNTLMAFRIISRLVSLDKLVHVLFRFFGLSALYIEIAARHALCTDLTNESRFSVSFEMWSSKNFFKWDSFVTASGCLIRSDVFCSLGMLNTMPCCCRGLLAFCCSGSKMFLSTLSIWIFCSSNDAWVSTIVDSTAAIWVWWPFTDMANVAKLVCNATCVAETESTRSSRSDNLVAFRGIFGLIAFSKRETEVMCQHQGIQELHCVELLLQ